MARLATCRAKAGFLRAAEQWAQSQPVCGMPPSWTVPRTTMRGDLCSGEDADAGLPRSRKAARRGTSVVGEGKGGRYLKLAASFFELRAPVLLSEAPAAHCLISAAVSRAGCEKEPVAFLSATTASPISRASSSLSRSSRRCRASCILAGTCARRARIEASLGDRLLIVSWYRRGRVLSSFFGGCGAARLPRAFLLRLLRGQENRMNAAKDGVARDAAIGPPVCAPFLIELPTEVEDDPLRSRGQIDLPRRSRFGILPEPDGTRGRSSWRAAELGHANARERQDRRARIVRQYRGIAGGPARGELGTVHQQGDHQIGADGAHEPGNGLLAS